jgi:hypothetical protein
MSSKHNIGYGDTMALRIIEAIIDHGLRAGPALLSGLENQHQRPRPRLAGRVKSFGRSQQAGNVHVVAAGVHHGLLDAVGVGHAFLAGVGEAGAFFDREGVEVGAQENGWAAAIVQEGGNTMTTNTGLDFEVAGDGAELGDAAGGGFFFLVGEFWVGVEVLVEVFVFVELGAVLGGDFGDVGHVGGCCFLRDMGGVEDVVVYGGLKCRPCEPYSIYFDNYVFYPARGKDDSTYQAEITSKDVRRMLAPCASQMGTG